MLMRVNSDEEENKSGTHEMRKKKTWVGQANKMKTS